MNLIAYLVETAIELAKTQLHGNDVKNALLDIIQKGVQAYETHTGAPLDPSLIRREEPLSH